MRIHKPLCTLVACAAAIASWGVARNSESLLNHVRNDLGRYSMIPASRDMSKHAALEVMTDRDPFNGYARAGLPLRFSFGMYRGTHRIPVIDDAIGAYVLPPAAPSIVTLDSMSLFDSGKAWLRPGSMRALVSALELISANPDNRIFVACHSDNTGTPNTKLRPSMVRAETVRDSLIDMSGVPVTRFTSQGCEAHRR
jgi:outer membrane protein OmpA-like peptidoglycan-associated protein